MILANSLKETMTITIEVNIVRTWEEILYV
jgi:hypothetical protein